MSGTRVGVVADLWRYPVKSLTGQRCRHAFAGPYGLQGDRCHAVISPGGALVTARRAFGLLEFAAAFDDQEASRGVRVTTPDGVTLAVDDPALPDIVGTHLGREVQIARAPAGVFDASPVHVITDASLVGLGRLVDTELEVRRFRPNIVLALDDPTPFTEGSWVGGRLRFGDGPELHVTSPTERCAVPTIDPDTMQRDPHVLRTLSRDRENLFGVYADVTHPGWLRVGDPVTLVGPPAP